MKLTWSGAAPADGSANACTVGASGSVVGSVTVTVTVSVSCASPSDTVTFAVYVPGVAYV